MVVLSFPCWEPQVVLYKEYFGIFLDTVDRQFQGLGNAKHEIRISVAPVRIGLVR